MSASASAPREKEGWGDGAVTPVLGSDMASGVERGPASEGGAEGDSEEWMSSEARSVLSAGDDQRAKGLQTSHGPELALPESTPVSLAKKRVLFLDCHGG